MTTAAIEPAVFSGKPKKLLDQMRDVARESREFDEAGQGSAGCLAASLPEAAYTPKAFASR